MKFALISTLTVFSVLGLSHQANAYNLEACAKNPMTSTPQSINLLQPIDQKMLNCIPKLDSIASQWRTKANNIQSAINKVKIGNNGTTNIEKIEYNVTGKYIYLVAKAKAAHTWEVKIPPKTIKEKVPVTKYRKVEECIARKKVFGREICIGFETKNMPYVEMEWRTVTIPGKTIRESASATCKYDYTFNLSTSEQKPIFNCGRGSLGNYKLDASAITKILNGEMPTLGSLITSVSITPPLIKDANRDEYHQTRNRIIASHPNSIVYFSSESFVNWASAENQGANVIVAALSGGGYSAELIRQIEQRLRNELTFMSAFASQTAINLGVEQIISMMTGNTTHNFGRYKVSVKVLNTPYVIQKCVVNSGDCTPEIKSPRLGFAIIATPIK